jgi:hypothetical protein
MGYLPGPETIRKSSGGTGVQVFKSNLSPDHRKLLELMQRIYFGHIENILVEDGRPVITRDTLVEREVKMGNMNGPHPEIDNPNFVLKQSQVEFFNRIAQMTDGRISRIEVKHGLPFLMRVAQPAV